MYITYKEKKERKGYLKNEKEVIMVFFSQFED